MILSDYTEAGWLNLLLRATAFAPPATLYFSLHTADPGESGVGSEFSGGSYARASLANNPTNFPLCSATGTPSKTTGATIAWPTATAAWGTATHWAIYDASTGGTNMIAHGALSTPITVASGDTPKVAAGNLTLTAANGSNGGLTNYTVRKLLDHTFGASTYTPPATIYLGLGTALSGETLTEWTESSYARQAAAFDAATSGAGTSANTDAEQFTASVADGTATLTHYGIWDDVSSGNLLAVGAINSSRSITTGDSADLAAGSCIVTFQ